MPGCFSRISRAARSPSSVCVGGMRMSTSATSGLYERTFSISSSAVPACPTTSKPASSSRRAMPSRSRTESSASTTRMGQSRANARRPVPQLDSRVARCGEIPTARHTAEPPATGRRVALCGEIATSTHTAARLAAHGAHAGDEPVQRGRRHDAAVPRRARPGRGALRHAARAARGGRAGPQPRLLGPARRRQDRAAARVREARRRSRLGLHRRGRDRRDDRLPHLDQPHDAPAAPRPQPQAGDQGARAARARRAEGVQRDGARRLPAEHRRGGDHRQRRLAATSRTT